MAIRVVSSSLISAEMKKKIETTFSKKHNEKVSFVYEIDKSLLGGLLVIDGEHYYDATIKGQLSAMKRALK